MIFRGQKNKKLPPEGSNLVQNCLECTPEAVLTIKDLQPRCTLPQDNNILQQQS